MILRIEEAIARANRNRETKLMKKDIAARLWPDSVESAQQVNMTKLCVGRTSRVAPEWVLTICEMTGCTADFLFGMSNE